MRHIKIAIGSIALVSLLCFIFWGIVKLQRPTEPQPVVPQGLPPAMEDTTVKQTQPVTQKQPVEVVFMSASEAFHFKDVQLLETVVKPGEKPVINIDGNLAVDMLKQVQNQLQLTQPTPSTIITGKNGDATRIVRGTAGTAIDVEQTLDHLEKFIANNPQKPQIDLKLALREDHGPGSFSATRERLGFRVLLAQHDTLHNSHLDDTDRNVNLALAVKAIDGLILAPGETFNFDKVVGPRSEKNGYKKAGVISRGRVIPGLGGGICQVSTTLYRAALLANQKIIERHNHSIYEGIEYAERGLDSAIAWGYKNLRFQNTLSTPVLLSCTAGDGSVHVEIFAERKPFDDIKVETRNEQVHDFKTETRTNSKLRKGDKKIVQPGVTGYSVEAFRLVLHQGKLKEERLSRDRYQTFNQVEEIRN